MAGLAYVSLEEAAELEGISYETMKKRAQRSSDKMGVKKASRGSGGKEMTLVAVNSLSKLGQNRWKEREKLKEMAETAADLPEEKTKGQEPWYVNADYEWFEHQYKTEYYKATELGNVIRRFLKESESHSRDLTTFTEEYAQENLGKSGRTFRRMVKDYQQAEAWAAKLSKEDGCSYDHLMVLALCRKPKSCGLFPSIPADMKQAIKNIWFNEDFAVNRRTRQDLYEVLEEIAVNKGWKKLPSYQTVVRYISYLMDDEKLRSAFEYQQKGIRKWKNENMVKRARDTKSLQVLEMLQGDEHTFDLWVMYKAKNGKEFPIRPKLVCWIDTRSRMIFGDLICKDADSQILKESLIKLIYVDLPGQVPRYLYIDNGKDYTSRQLMGIDRKDRHNQAAKDRFFDMEFDRPTRGFYHDMGIEDEHISMPYEPWTKGQIERSFGTAIEKFSKKFASYTGTLTGSKTDAKVPKEIKKMAEQGKLLTMEEFYEEWKKYKEKYINRTHRGLRNAGEEFKKPLEVFENEERYIKAAPPRSFAVMALMKSEEALVNNVGIKRFGYYYMDDELLPYINQKIHIKVDPYDVTSIYCINNKGGLICQAQCQELIQFGKVSDETLQEHRKMQRRQLRAVREELEEANRPFDGDEDAAHKGVVGGVKLTIGKDGKKSKVVAMPTDETYRKNKEFRKPNECEYMNSQAKKALERLQKMGGA